MESIIWLGFSLNIFFSFLQAKLCTLTVTDEEGLQHVNQEMEAKAIAPFISDRFVSIPFWFSVNSFFLN